MTVPQASVKYNTRKFNTDGISEVRILSLFPPFMLQNIPPLRSLRVFFVHCSAGNCKISFTVTALEMNNNITVGNEVIHGHHLKCKRRKGCVRAYRGN